MSVLFSSNSGVFSGATDLLFARQTRQKRISVFLISAYLTVGADLAVGADLTNLLNKPQVCRPGKHPVIAAKKSANLIGVFIRGPGFSSSEKEELLMIEELNM